MKKLVLPCVAYSLLALFSSPLFTACSVGALSNNGTLPKLDGSQLTNISASTVSGMSPTSQATGSSLVTRDGSGNFSAGTITANLSGNATSATFASGHQGADLTAASTLQLGTDGDFFNVNGTGSINGLLAMNPGARVTLSFNGAMKLIDSPSFRLLGNGNFLTVSGDVFVFVSLGSGNWREISRTVSNESRVIANGLPSGTINTSYLPLRYGPSSIDTQNEYNAAAGTFVANQSGYYSYTAAYALNNDIWSAGGSCIISVFVNAGITPVQSKLQYIFTPGTSGAAQSCQVAVTGRVYLSNTDSLLFQGTLSSSSSSILSGSLVGIPANNFNYLMIERIGN